METRMPSGWKTLLARANQLVGSATHPAAELPVEGHLPGFDGATGWVNSEPLSRPTCAAAWCWSISGPTPASTGCGRLPMCVPGPTSTRPGLTVIGVHTPEFDFEHDLGNVRREVDGPGGRYPVAIDSDYAIWPAFDNHYWPALYFVDAKGRSATTASVRATTRSPRWSSSSCCRGRRWRRRPDLGRRSMPRGVEAAADWAAAVAGELPRLPAHRGLRLAPNGSMPGYERTPIPPPPGCG